MGISVHLYSVYSIIWHQLRSDGYEEFCGYSTNCFQQTTIANIGAYLVVFGLPLYKLVFQTFFKSHFQVSSTRKTIIGMFLQLLGLASCIAVEFTAEFVSDQHGNVTCPLMGNSAPNSLSLDYWWMAFPLALNQLSEFLLVIAAIEFVFSQSPYSMKGLLVGFAYSSVGIFAIVGYLPMLVQSHS